MRYSSLFSEAPRLKIKEMDNFEENELGETVRTTQCSSCLRYYKERTVYSLCCECLDDFDINKQKESQIELTSSQTLCTSSNREFVEYAVHGPEDWQEHQWKAKGATRNVKRDGEVVLHIEKLIRNMDGLSSTASSWTTSSESKSRTK